MTAETVHRVFPEDCIPVVFATDNGYIPPLCVALASLIRHTHPSKKYDVIILCIGRAYELLSPLLPMFCRENISVRAVDLKHASVFFTSNHISLAAYNRLYIPELLPEYDKVLYLDCDIIVCADIAELYNLPIGDNYLAACEDYNLTQGSEDYVPPAKAALREQGCPVEGHINSGILVMNLAAMRRDHIQQRMLECAAAQNHYYHDQCVLNIICRGKIYPLPLAWNMCIMGLNRETMSEWHYNQTAELLRSHQYRIVHFTAAKPWKHLRRPYSHLWWQEARHVPFPVVKKLLHVSYPVWIGLRLILALLPIPERYAGMASYHLYPVFRWNA